MEWEERWWLKIGPGRDPLERARLFAAEKHRGQQRRYGGEPHVMHVERVAGILEAHGYNSPVVLAAALLHDSLEATETSIRDIESAFGLAVAELVYWISDLETGSARERTLLSSWRLARAPFDAKLIKLAEVLDNVPNVIKHDPRFASKYRAEKRLILDAMATHEGEALTSAPLFKRARDLV